MLSVCLYVPVLKSCMCVISSINLKMICDFPFLLLSQLSDEPLPGRNKFLIIGRNAVLLIISPLTILLAPVEIFVFKA